jgi:PAS domain S-box-containing protein
VTQRQLVEAGAALVVSGCVGLALVALGMPGFAVAATALVAVAGGILARMAPETTPLPDDLAPVSLPPPRPPTPPPGPTPLAVDTPPEAPAPPGSTELVGVFRAAVDATLDGILITDASDTVVYANRAAYRILDAPSEGLLGEPISARVPGLDEESSTSGVRRAGRKVLGIEWQTEARRWDGSRFAAEVSVSAPEGTAMGVYQIRDITDRREEESKQRKVNAVLEGLRDQAMEANKAKSTFLANMSHELRTPLNAILGYSEMLGEELEDPDAQQDVHKIQAAGRHLLSLINSILDLSKIEAGRMELFMETVSVAFLVRDVCEIAEPLALNQRNAFVVDVADDVGRMVADEVKLRQVLVNLLANAFKFTEDGEVRLTARRVRKGETDWIAFSVRDSGIGIAQDDLARLFEEFSQADGSTTRQFGGTGLGLAISRRFARMMGGDITVESELGKGSTFTVQLPANTVEREGQEDEPRGGGEIRVLVIDDDPGVRELLARTLAAEGCRVLTAASGVQGIERARSFEPDVITLDIMMPGMDGWAVLAALKDDEALASVPVVVVSMVDERRTGFALGASAYLTKPIDRKRLVQLVSGFHRGSDAFDVLIVDDQAHVRDVVRRTLETHGWAIREAADGRAALAAIEERVPTVMLLDLMMPGMDGFALLDALSERDLPDFAIVVMTAMDLDARERQQLESRVTRVLQKSAYSRDELLGIVRDKVTAHAIRTAREAGARLQKPSGQD